MNVHIFFLFIIVYEVVIAVLLGMPIVMKLLKEVSKK